MEIKKIANLDEKSKDILRKYWFIQLGGLMRCSHSSTGVEEALSAIKIGAVAEPEWKEVEEQKVYMISIEKEDGEIKDIEVSPFNDEFITYWNKLKPLMEEEQIEKLKIYHKNIE